MGFFDSFKKSKYEVLNSIGHSYVVGNNGEPLVVYYNKNTGLYTSQIFSEPVEQYFLNIRRPVIIDASNRFEVSVPTDLPDECDGVIFINYGSHDEKAFYIRNKGAQSMALNMDPTPIHRGAPKNRNRKQVPESKPKDDKENESILIDICFD